MENNLGHAAEGKKTARERRSVIKADRAPVITCGKSHMGRVRESNQDRFSIRRTGDQGVLLAVADGMGGEAGGETASRLAIECVEGFDPGSGRIDTTWRRIFLSAHEAIAGEIRANKALRGMGTTLTALFISGAKARYAHVGDSRIYHWHDGELKRITRDHTIPGILLERGEISAEDARNHHMRNMLQKCLGCDSHKPDLGRFQIGKGDTVFVCSDGLHGEIPEESMTAILRSAATLEEAIEEMLKAALDAGGSDNITVAGARIG